MCKYQRSSRGTLDQKSPMLGSLLPLSRANKQETQLSLPKSLEIKALGPRAWGWRGGSRPELFSLADCIWWSGSIFPNALAERELWLTWKPGWVIQRLCFREPDWVVLAVPAGCPRAWSPCCRTQLVQEAGQVTSLPQGQTAFLSSILSHCRTPRFSFRKPKCLRPPPAHGATFSTREERPKVPCYKRRGKE